MNTTRFKKLVSIVLENEGGSKVTDHPKDPGGLTKYGICQRYHPNVDIRNLSEEQAEQIYLNEYYLPCGADAVTNEELALNMFDSAVNPGLGWANKTIQKLVNVNTDAKIGPKTIEAINSFYDQKSLIALFKRARIEYYEKQVKEHPEKAIFIQGWKNRVNKLKL